MDLPQNPMGTTRSSWLQPEQRGVFIRWLLPRVNSLPKWSTSPACPPSAVKSSPLTTETPLFFPPGLCAWCWCPMIRWKRMGLLSQALGGWTSLSPWDRTPPAADSRAAPSVNVLWSDQLLPSPGEPGGCQGLSHPLQRNPLAAP